jgi:hypothetical protein
MQNLWGHSRSQVNPGETCSRIALMVGAQSAISRMHENGVLKLRKMHVFYTAVDCCDVSNTT